MVSFAIQPCLLELYSIRRITIEVKSHANFYTMLVSTLFITKIRFMCMKLNKRNFYKQKVPTKFTRLSTIRP